MVGWLLCVALLWTWSQQQGASFLDVMRAALSDLQGNPYAAAWLLLAYALRVLLLFPTSLLTLAAGFLLGPWWGSAVASIGTLITTTIGYFVGLFAARGGRQAHAFAKVLPLRKLRASPFETVLLSRVLLLPGDLVNYACGYVRLSLVPFLIASVLGGLPGLVSMVLAGASLESLDEGARLNGHYLLLSLFLVGSSLAISRYFKKRRAEIRVPKKG